MIILGRNDQPPKNLFRLLLWHQGTYAPMSAPQKRPERPTTVSKRWGSHLMEMIMETWGFHIVVRELGGQRHTQSVHCMNFLTKGTAIHWRMASSGLGSNINARMDSKHFKTVSAGFQDSFKISRPQWCRHVKHLRRQKTVGCFLNESPRTNDLLQTICFILGVVVSLRLDTFNWFLRDTPQFQAVFAIGVAGGQKRKSPANNKEAQNMS